MDFTDFVWGALTVGAGVFIAVYGFLLFKFALAAMGFGLGFVGAWWVLQDQESGMRLLISLVAGALLAILFFAMVRFGVYIAGAVLGLVISIALGGVIAIWGSAPATWLTTILAAGGLIGGGILGPRLGRTIIILATAAAGSLLIVDGMQTWFASSIESAGADASATLGNSLSMTLFAVLVVISYLGQENARRLRHRVIN